jgi:hypothetical protein
LKKGVFEKSPQPSPALAIQLFRPAIQYTTPKPHLQSNQRAATAAAAAGETITAAAVLHLNLLLLLLIFALRFPPAFRSGSPK